MCPWFQVCVCVLDTPPLISPLKSHITVHDPSGPLVDLVDHAPRPRTPPPPPQLLPFVSRFNVVVIR